MKYHHKVLIGTKEQYKKEIIDEIILKHSPEAFVEYIEIRGVNNTWEAYIYHSDPNFIQLLKDEDMIPERLP